MRRLWIGLGIIIALLILGVVGLNLWVQAYLRGPAFRQLVAAKTGQALRADADCEPLAWSGSSVFTAELTARGEAGEPLESLDAQQVRANVDWRAILDGAWRVRQIDIARLDAKIRTETPAAVPAAPPGPVPDAPPPKRGWLPNRFQLDRVTVQDANVEIGTAARARGVALGAQPEGSGWVFDGSGGRLELPGRLPWTIDQFRVRLQQGVVYLTEAALRLGATGALQASGEIGGSRAPFDLRAQWQGVDAADLLDAAWKRRLGGKLSGEARSVGQAGQPAVTTGKFRLADGRLEGLPVQREIAQFTRSPQFERMPLREVSGDFTTDGAATSVKNLLVDSPGLLRVEGEARRAADGAIDGTFRVGVTAQSLQWLPGSQEKVFLVEQGGYRWTDVKIGGTMDQPTEDLSVRLARAVGEQAIDTGVELLEKAPSDPAGAVKKALDILSPLVP